MNKEKTLKIIQKSIEVLDQPDIIAIFEEYKTKVESGELLLKADWLHMSQLLGLNADVVSAQADFLEASIKSDMDYLDEVTKILDTANSDIDSAVDTIKN